MTMEQRHATKGRQRSNPERLHTTSGPLHPYAPLKWPPRTTRRSMNDTGYWAFESFKSHNFVLLQF